MSRRLYSKGVYVSLALVTGLIIIAVACFAVALMSDKLFNTMLYKQLIFIPGTRIYELWSSPTHLGYISIYLFNITNADDVELGEKPHVEEVGPFVYEVSGEKNDITFSNENPPRMVQYTSIRKPIYQPSRSTPVPLNATLILPNLQHLVTSSNDVYQVLSQWTSTESDWAFAECTISDLIWGCPDSWFAECSCDWGLLPPDVTKGTIDTGAYDLFKGNEMLEVGGTSQYHVYEQDEVNIIRGSEGIRLRPGMELGMDAWVHFPHLCRALRFTAKSFKPSEHRPDLELLEMRLQSVKPDAATNLEERIYCDSTGACPPKGMINLESCLEHHGNWAPIYLSKPRFLDTDPRVAERISGLAPPYEKNHSTYLAVEPVTGLSLESHQRVQLNAFMPNTDKVLRNHEKPAYVPLMWFSHDILASKSIVDELKDNILSRRKYIQWTSIASCIVASVVACILVLHQIFRQCRLSSLRSAEPDTTTVKIMMDTEDQTDA